MQTTANYSLNKPEPNDLFSLEHWNQNTDILDTALAPEFEDYEIGRVENSDEANIETDDNNTSMSDTKLSEIPDAQTSLSEIKSKTRIDKLFSHIKAFCKKCLTLEMLVKDCLTDDDNLPLAASQGKYLQNQVDELSNVVYVTLSASGWNNSAPYTQSIQLSFFNDGDRPLIQCGSNPSTKAEKKNFQKQWNFVDSIVVSESGITATCKFDKPSIDLPIIIKGR